VSRPSASTASSEPRIGWSSSAGATPCESEAMNGAFRQFQAARSLSGPLATAKIGASVTPV
jgi:hypothetical protein